MKCKHVYLPYGPAIHPWVFYPREMKTETHTKIMSVYGSSIHNCQKLDPFTFFFGGTGV
jgi:hypothetical protein